MKPITNNLTEIFDSLLEKSNGIIKDYLFIASFDFKTELRKYKDIDIVYLINLPKNHVYYVSIKDFEKMIRKEIEKDISEKLENQKLY